jgi:hypothetical protein
MTRIHTLVFLAAGAALFVAAGTASAQPYPYNVPQYGVGFRPGLSPYLNLLRGGDQAANYFLGVVPEFERRQNSAVFRGALLELDQRVSRDITDLGLGEAVTSTGHITAFGNTGGYFGSLTGRTAAGAARQTQPAAPGRPRQQ